jgi:hypothetical protein
LTLPITIEYLNEARRTFTGGYLLDNVRASRLASLAVDCNSSEEFESRLSALCDVLSRMHIRDEDMPPDTHEMEGSLQRVGVYLASRLSAEAIDRVRVGLGDLRAITRIRAWRQHGSESAGAFARLQAPYPPRAWGSLWDVVRARAVAALDAIREEVQSATSEAG